MKLKNVLIRVTAIVAVIVTFLSCDNDFNSVGSEIIGDVNFEDKKYSTIPVSYSRKFERVRTSRLVHNNQALHANVLGVYNDPVYGQSVYSVLSQVQPNTFNPDFGDNAVLDSVVLNLPYFSEATATATDDNGATITTYELDSIYGSQPFKLSVYQSDYFLRDFDPASSDRQVYYSDDIQNNFGPEVEPASNLLYSTTSFVPSASELTLLLPDGTDEGTEPDVSRVSPRLRIKFSDEVRDRFKEQFLDKEGGVELSNANNFFNYFRGIYFKTEPVNNDGSLVLFNMSGGDITLHYTSDSGTPVERTQKTLELSFVNNIVNAITTTLDPTIAEELKDENQDKINGEDNLYLKGGDGSYAVIDLFGGTVINENGEEENELSFLRRQDWLINDANLTFYVNRDKVTSGGDTEPERIYVFNLKTGTILADYSLDSNFQLLNEEDPVNSILSHLGRINRDSDKKGESYKIRLTQHILSLLDDEEIENVKIGVAVSQNVNITTTAIGDTPTTNDEIIPSSSIISHEGTILYGNGENVPEAKRLKLDIFYTASKKN
ncbi:DUF4270 domain-containing protein [Aquimarina sediminis]|uniref:DUF4270 domain-containing protein n=1 Tax=Aquimarina sediminis TaxID=2070536 RepID=UPI000CA04256|nr:DUF4270 domain-containing protein [Aquimarina sediminis]